MMDLIKAEKAIEPFISLKWTKDEVIKGYKTFEGVTYNFYNSMVEYKQYRVIKFMYEYKDTYCFIDLNLFTQDGSINAGNKDPMRYYVDDKYKKFKTLKKMLPPELTEEYLNDVRNTIGYITPLAGRIELINSIEKYNVLPPEKIEKLRQLAKEYADKNGIDTIDYNEIQEIIKNKSLIFEIQTSNF